MVRECPSLLVYPSTCSQQPWLNQAGPGSQIPTPDPSTRAITWCLPEHISRKLKEQDGREHTRGKSGVAMMPRHPPPQSCVNKGSRPSWHCGLSQVMWPNLVQQVMLNQINAQFLQCVISLVYSEFINLLSVIFCTLYGEIQRSSKSCSSCSLEYLVKCQLHI